MAASSGRRRWRKLIPGILVTGLLAVPGAGLVSAVKEARRAAHSSATT
jgi:hypothetical protein